MSPFSVAWHSSPSSRLSVYTHVSPLQLSKTMQSGASIPHASAEHPAQALRDLKRTHQHALCKDRGVRLPVRNMLLAAPICIAAAHMDCAKRDNPDIPSRDALCTRSNPLYRWLWSDPAQARSCRPVSLLRARLCMQEAQQSRVRGVSACAHQCTCPCSRRPGCSGRMCPSSSGHPSCTSCRCPCMLQQQRLVGQAHRARHRRRALASALARCKRPKGMTLPDCA